MPLIEIVSEPDMRSAEEVIAYLEKLRLLIQYLGASALVIDELLSGITKDYNMFNNIQIDGISFIEHGILPLYRLLSSTIPLQGMIPAVIMEMTVRDLRMVFQFHFAPFLAL